MVEKLTFQKILDYNRNTVRYDFNTKTYVDVEGECYQGIGVGRHIYGKAKVEETDEMTLGKALHQQIENGTPEDKAAIAISKWLDDNVDPIDGGPEIFVHGELFGVPTVGWIDYLGLTDVGPTIIDYKFTGHPSRTRFDLKWKMQLVLYMFLLKQLGVFAPRLTLLSIKPGSGKLHEHNLTPGEYGSVLSLARQFSMKNRVANI